jgi:hypothetical protein
MGTMPSQPYTERARRFPLHFPVYFRQPPSPTWLEGTTENISYTGVLLRSSYSLALETAIEMKLRLGPAAKRAGAGEIRCKGTVVRLESRDVPETPVALVVAIRDYRIVRRPEVGGRPV